MKYIYYAGSAFTHTLQSTEEHFPTKMAYLVTIKVIVVRLPLLLTLTLLLPIPDLNEIKAHTIFPENAIESSIANRKANYIDT